MNLNIKSTITAELTVEEALFLQEQLAEAIRKSLTLVGGYSSFIRATTVEKDDKQYASAIAFIVSK